MDDGTTELAMGTPHNILVISDVHLGEDLRPGGEALEHVARAERGLVAFLRYYTRSRLDGLPWKLVVNGDLVDLLAAFAPDEATRNRILVTNPERLYDFS